MKRNLSPSPAKVKAKATSKTRYPLPQAEKLLDWYDRHRRVLPWRALAGKLADPYAVWLSEIMLQQTTVAAVGPYFQKFLRKWPTVQDLAAAPLDDIMRNWAGLGYYRRARMLHACAQYVVEQYDGVFPDSEADLLALPGFGPYTAAAVMAIAFDRRANVVDGNVERVMARLFAIKTPLPKAKVEMKAAALRLLPQSRYGDYAQALMDLGATICTPRSPKCLLCPWQDVCEAKAMDIAAELPRREAKAAKPIRRAVAFALFDQEGRLLLRKRPPEGLLGGMMEVPSGDWREGEMPTLAKARTQAPADVDWVLLPGGVRHVFTHFEFEVAVAVGHLRNSKKAAALSGSWVALTALADEALPSIMRKIALYAAKSL